MAVPDFQTWFLPLLRLLGDGEVHRIRDVYEILADELGLSAEDRSEMLPSGKQLKYINRIGWARTYLKKAGIVQAPGRAQVQITPRGQDVLATPPERLNVKFLNQYTEFREFHDYQPPRAPSESPPAANARSEDGEETPEETLGRVHRTLRDELAEELLVRVRQAPPHFFETLVIDLLVRMGYGGSLEDAGQTLGRTGDGGIDGVINEDRLGLDVVCIQAKRWKDSVGRPVVQAFAGSLEGVRAKKGVLITSSDFTSGARDYVKQIEKRIVLVDGRRLASLMIEHDLGVSAVASYDVKRIDSDYFEES